MEEVEPRACRRMSRALCRVFPRGVRFEEEGFEFEERRWDSERRRCRAKSFFRCCAESSASSGVSWGLGVCWEDVLGAAVVVVVDVGGLEVRNAFSSCLLEPVVEDVGMLSEIIGISCEGSEEIPDQSELWPSSSSSEGSKGCGFAFFGCCDM